MPNLASSWVSLIGCALLVTGCADNYPRSVAERARSLGAGVSSASAVFGPASRTCVAVGDYEWASAELDPVARDALNLSGRDQYSVVVVQFDDRSREILKRRFHWRNPFVFVDIQSERMDATVRCLGPTSPVEVGLGDEIVALRIP